MREMTQNIIDAIKKVGNQVAGDWGGVCYDFETFPRKKVIRFHCKEHGENFVTDVSYDEMEKEYHFNMSGLTKGMKARKIAPTKQENTGISNEMREKLMGVGEDVASMWGAECIDLEVDFKKKEVVFSCNEMGEDFITSLTFADIKTDYNIEVA